MFRSKKGNRVDDASGSESEFSSGVLLLSADLYSELDGTQKDWWLLQNVFGSFGGSC